MEAGAKVLRERLAQVPAPDRELRAVLRTHGMPDITWSGVRLWLDMVRVPPSGTWERKRADLYALADEWVPAGGVIQTGGRQLLVRRDLGGFVPARAPATPRWAGPPSAQGRTAG